MHPAAGELDKGFGIEAGAPRRGVEVGGQGQAHADEERPQGHERPISEDPLRPGAGGRHPPQSVQLVLDGDQHQHPGAGDAHDADCRRLRRRTGKILDPKRRLLADRRHEISKGQAEEFLPRVGEGRKHRQDADHDDAERHQ